MRRCEEEGKGEVYMINFKLPSQNFLGVAGKTPCATSTFGMSQSYTLNSTHENLRTRIINPSQNSQSPAKI
jgi:hypothetical protein